MASSRKRKQTKTNPYAIGPENEDEEEVVVGPRRRILRRPQFDVSFAQRT